MQNGYDNHSIIPIIENNEVSHTYYIYIYQQQQMKLLKIKQ